MVVYEVFEGENDAEYQQQEIVWVAAPSLEKHKADWWPGIVAKNSVGNPSVEVSYMKPHPFKKTPRKFEKSRIQILEFQMKLLKHLTPALPSLKSKFEFAMKKAKRLDKDFVRRFNKKKRITEDNPFSLSANNARNGAGKNKTKRVTSPVKKKLTTQQSLPPDPPEVYPCMTTLKGMKIKDQKDLVLRPGDRIWFKSAIYGDRYLKAVIKEIYPGPGRSINLDIFESPTNSTPIQKYELKDGEEGNRLPAEGRIMMRYWTLVPGRFKAVSCPFNKMATNFFNAAKNATKDIDGPAKQFLNKLKDPSADVLFSEDEDNLDADLDFLNDGSNSASLSPTPNRRKKKKSKLYSSDNEEISLSPLTRKEPSLSPLNIRKKSLSPLNICKKPLSPLNLRKKSKNWDTIFSSKDSSTAKKRSSSRKNKKQSKSLKNSEDPPFKHKKKRKINTNSLPDKIPKKVKKYSRSTDSQPKIDNYWRKKKRSLFSGDHLCSGTLLDHDDDQVADTFRQIGCDAINSKSKKRLRVRAKRHKFL